MVTDKAEHIITASIIKTMKEIEAHGDERVFPYECINCEMVACREKMLRRAALLKLAYIAAVN